MVLEPWPPCPGPVVSTAAGQKVQEEDLCAHVQPGRGGYGYRVGAGGAVHACILAEDRRSGKDETAEVLRGN